MPILKADTINTDRLKSATNHQIYEQGETIFQRGKVEVEEVTEISARCVIRDGRSNKVELRLTSNYLQFKCDCSHAQRGLICEHDVAAALAVREYLQVRKPSRWKAQLNQALQDAQSPTTRPSAARPYLLFFSLRKVTFPYSSISSWKIVPCQLMLNALPKELHSGRDLHDKEAFPELLADHPELAKLIKLPSAALQPGGCVNAGPESVVLANIFIERERGYYYSSSPTNYLALIASTGSLLFHGSVDNPVERRLRVLTGGSRMQLEVEKLPDGVRLRAKIAVPGGTVYPQEGSVEVISQSPSWVIAGDTIFQLENSGKAEFLMSWLSSPVVIIPARDEAAFLDSYLLPLAEQIPLEGPAIEREVIQAEPVWRLYLSETKSGLQAGLRFGYGEYEVGYDPKMPADTIARSQGGWTLTQVLRQPDKEEAAFRTVTATNFGLKRALAPTAVSTFTLRARTHPVDFLMYQIPRLAQHGFEIYGEEALKSVRVNRNRPSLSFNVSSGIDWFDVQVAVNFGDLEVDFKDIRRAVRKHERFVKLADGTIGEFPEEWLERYKHLFGLGEETDDGVRLSNYHVTLLDQLLGQADRVQLDQEFQRRREHLRNFTGIQAVDLPAGFMGELRPYQKSGYDWLHFLHEFGFGGCLADDMGLGKTIQALAFLQALKEGLGREPHNSATSGTASLVVVPRSLLVNWQREASRFTPDLRLLIYFDKDRVKDTSTFGEYDVILTTYGVMLRDIEVLRSYRFHYVFLDESQAIKNPLALTSKAARLLQAENRAVLTGTPVENSTLELWSQFAFLNPGLLGNLEYFKNEFTSPIERKADDTTAQFLRKMVFPFILRRTKDQVAPELPSRTERLIYCDMDPAQRKLYNRTRDYYRGILLGQLEKEGLNQTRFKILEGLLRLRQISNHPHLMDAKFRGESGKFELLLETLETLRSEEHKVLVFSQFVQMLRLVRAALDQREIPYTYLDGHTKNRQEVVDTFQESPHIPFFLISLKAGGVGLNLTAADYVIHIDPWWNPAVEMQASDRTHRIGQDKPVFVYKLISRDTVEEKILLLQARKKQLVDQLITTESGFLKNLTQQDVEILFGN